MTCRIEFKPRSRSNRGFTLLEVLVSLTIMALITGVAFAGLSIGIDSWRRGSRKIEDLDHLFAVERLLQRQIALADSSIFRGDGRQLEFTTTYSVANGPGDAVWVKYLVDINNHLTYFETPLAQYTPDQPSQGLQQTLAGVSTTGFHYLYTMPGLQREWVTESMKESPLAVRVDISGDVLNIPLVNKQ